MLVPHFSSYFRAFDSNHQCSSKCTRNASPNSFSAMSNMQTHHALALVAARIIPASKDSILLPVTFWRCNLTGWDCLLLPSSHQKPQDTYNELLIHMCKQKQGAKRWIKNTKIGEIVQNKEENRDISNSGMYQKKKITKHAEQPLTCCRLASPQDPLK